MKNLKFTIPLLLLSSVILAQPTNDVCSGAIDLGTLPTPNACDGGGTEGQGSTVSFTGLTNVNATADNPYTYIADCQGSGTDMANPAQDVWYSITATGNAVTIDISNLSGFSNHSIGFWEGNCAGLTARGCANGMGTSSTVFEPTTPGQTYYIQFSGGGASDEGTFDMDISNSNDCSQCVLGSNLTVDPLPVNGTYTAGTEVNFCYTISEFEKINTNWVHGVSIENLGAGWDNTFGTAGISVTSTPNSCANNYGDWQWFDAPSGCTGSGGPGWFYILPTSANPCQNFGDPDVAEPGGMGGCTLTFCFTLRTDPLASCNPASPQSLGFDINTFADGESGSWTSIACQNDPEYQFSAIQACCTSPTAVVNSQIVCFGDSNGVATVTAGSSSDPFKYEWYNSGGTISFLTGSTSSTTDVQSSLFQDTYTIVVTDNNGCQAATDLTMTTNPGATITSDVDDVLCGNDSKTISTFVAGPAGATFSWTASNDIGFGTSGSNTQIGTFTAVNNTGSTIVSDVIVTPNAAGCNGIPDTFSLSVNPTPQVTANYQADCSSADIGSSFTPAPTSYNVEFTNGLVPISTGMGMGVGIGTSSVTVSNITPTPLENGQIQSACYSLRHGCYNDIEYLAVTVNGTTYTSTNGVPAGATLNADLTTLLAGVNGATNDEIHSGCLPQSFLDLFDGQATNVDWDLSFSDTIQNSCAMGNAVGEMVSWEVVVENTPEYNFSWSNAANLTGTTSGTTTIGTLPTVTAESAGSYTLTVTDDVGCNGLDTAIFNCPLSIKNLVFKAYNVEEGNKIEWTRNHQNEIDSYIIEGKNEKEIGWRTIFNVKSKNKNHHSVIDKNYWPGINYYRLKQMNSDNTFEYSQIISINNYLKERQVEGVYNAFGQQVKIDAKGVKFILYSDGTLEKKLDF